MSEKTEKPHLSATQLEMFAKCPEQYRRRYIENERIPPGMSMLKGTGVHRGAEHNFRQKIESREDLPAAEIVEAAVAGFEAEIHGGYTLTEEERSEGAKNVIGKIKDDVAILAELHAEAQAPDYQPVLVEHTVRIELPGPRDLLGVIDLADTNRRVVDFKTAGKSKNQADADDSVQLTVYAAAHLLETGTPAKSVRLDTLVQTKFKASRQVVESSRDIEDFTALANRINAISDAIDAGVFPPATPGAWWCGPKWCGYWSTCPFVNSKRKALAGE